MRHFLLFALFFTLACPYLIYGNEAKPHTILGKNLSAFWAKEYTGLDLVMDMIDRDRLIFPELTNRKIPYAIFDLGFEKDHITLSPGHDIFVPPQMNGRRTMRAHHGTSVANILSGPKNIRMTNVGELVGLGGIAHAFQYQYFYKKMQERGFLPKIVSNSLGWKSEKIVELVKKAEQEDEVIWLLAAGNAFPEPVRPLERDSRALLVGSFAPNGLTSYEAQIHEKMAILAPANNELYTIDGRGNLHKFGASSGATPIVAATLINVAFYLPKISRDQAKTLLRKTGWSSAEVKMGHANFPPLLNSFKATVIARNIFLKCRTNLVCIDQQIKDPLTYLSAKKNDLKFKDSERQLRSQALMGEEHARKKLVALYKKKQLFWNAEYFNFISTQTLELEKMEALSLEAISHALFEFNSYRYIPLYSKEFRDHLNQSDRIKEAHKKKYLELSRENLKGL